MKMFTMLLSFTIIISCNCVSLDVFLKNSLFKNLKPIIFKALDLSINGTRCAKDLKIFVTDLGRFKMWAINMLDASSKLHSGIFHGNGQLTGNYDQCLSVQKIANGSEITGQYCTVPLVPNQNVTKHLYQIINTLRNKLKVTRKIDWSTFNMIFKFSYGLCVPKSCSAKYLNQLWNHFKKLFTIGLQAKIFEESCYYRNKPINTNQIDSYTFSIFLFILSLEVVSTGYDIYLRQFRKEQNVLTCLSLYTNTKKLLSTRYQNDTMTCLYGIRFISMLWIISGHIATTKILSPTVNSLYIVSEWTKRLENTFFFASTYAVDTFFSISGLLVVYTNLKYWKNRKNLPLAYLHRFCRLAPALLATILINISMVKYVTEGPFSSTTLKLLKTNCENHWWSTLFFINNVVKFSEQCLPHTWYLAVDTQLYLSSPLLLICIKKNPAKAFLGITALCISSFIYTWITVIKNNFGFIVFWEVQDKSAAFVYLSTISRMPAWLIGTYFGYLLHRNNFKKIYIANSTNLVLWTLSVSTMLSLIFYQTVFFKEEFNIYRSALFNTFSRSLWSLCTCYIIFSCYTGRGGVINTFLSQPIFLVLGKLTYSIYLIHVTSLYVVMLNKKQASYFSNFEIFYDFWANLVIILVCAAVLHLVFEAPAMSVWSHLQSRKNKKI